MPKHYEPSSVRLRDTPIAGEFVNFILSLGFYLVCAVIAVLPKKPRDILNNRFVGWSEDIDERRYR